MFKGYVEKLSAEKGREKDMELYRNVEELAPRLIARNRKIYKGVSTNVDFYSGFGHSSGTVHGHDCHCRNRGLIRASN